MINNTQNIYEKEIKDRNKSIRGLKRKKIQTGKAAIIYVKPGIVKGALKSDVQAIPVCH